jgi:hypothetical protein
MYAIWQPWYRPSRADLPVLEVGQVFDDLSFEKNLVRHERGRLDEGHLGRRRDVEDRVARRLDQRRPDGALWKFVHGSSLSH